MSTVDPTTVDNPIPLRWGLGDVLHGDDDTVTVCLSGPNGEPYWLELEPERAAAFRDDLATPDDADAGEYPPATAWHVQVLLDDEWAIARPGASTLDEAREREAAWKLDAYTAGPPDRGTRILREDTTYTVEPNESEGGEQQ